MSRERGASLPWPRLLAEFLAIVAGVLVALAVDQWVQSRAERELAGEALRTLEAELAQNQAQLERRIEYHESVVPGLDSLGRTVEAGRRVRLVSLDVLPEGMGFWLLRDDAWETAKITEAVRQLDLGLVSLLSLTYSLQEALRETERATASGILQPQFFGADVDAGAIVFVSVMMSDVLTIERELAQYQDELLRLIREGLDLPPEGGEPPLEIR